MCVTISARRCMFTVVQAAKTTSQARSRDTSNPNTTSVRAPRKHKTAVLWTKKSDPLLYPALMGARKGCTCCSRCCLWCRRRYEWCALLKYNAQSCTIMCHLIRTVWMGSRRCSHLVATSICRLRNTTDSSYNVDLRWSLLVETANVSTLKLTDTSRKTGCW